MDRADERWAGLKGGYRLPYDPRPALDRLAAGEAASAWAELWEDLHHQGDVDEASYAAAPELVRLHRTGDWNTFALVATIEEARREPHNPPPPSWLQEKYATAWRRLVNLALIEFEAAQGEELVASLFAVLALSKEQASLARLAMMTEDERMEALDRLGSG